MFIYGVVNASPDSLESESIVASESDALDRSRSLIADGADGIDIGGQGSTDNAEVVDWETEWLRVDTVINSVAKLGVEVSIDSWRPEVVERALQAGANVINAADGMQSERMWEVASNFDVPIVVPFLSGQNPREMSIVKTDPIKAMKDFFSQRWRKLNNTLWRRTVFWIRAPVSLRLTGSGRKDLNTKSTFILIWESCVTFPCPST